MREVEITIGRLLRIFWLFAWRSVIGGAILGAVIGFVIGFVMGVVGGTREHVALAGSVAGMLVGATWAVLVLKMALQKEYSDFRIMLIER